MEESDKKPGPKPWIPSDSDLKKIEKCAARGMTQEQIAPLFNIHPGTFSEKKSIFPAIGEALNRGKSAGIEIITNALFDNAESGNAVAQLFFLKCRAGWIEADKKKEADNLKSQNTLLEKLVNKIE